MFKSYCLAAVVGIVLFAASAAVPGKAFAATTNYTTEGKATIAATTDYTIEDTDPSDPATVNIEQRQYAQKRARGGGPGAKRKPGTSSRSRGAKPGNRPSAGGKKKRDRDVNVNRNVNVNVKVKHRGNGWRGARWGAVVFGVTLGTAIVVAANTPPYPPDPSLCWTWTNSALTRGYWYYCDGP